jgi:hypothetical protein
MYAPRIVLQQVIELFTTVPYYRDERYETIEYIVNKYYLADYGKSIKMDYKLMSDIDRAFRNVQQLQPQLRGKNWIDRQRQSGEISAAEFQYMKSLQEDIDEIIVQLKLF